MADDQDDPTDIDELMRRIDEEVEEAKIKMARGEAVEPFIVTPKYIDAVVAYQRQQRARRQAGVKTKKGEASAGPKLDIQSLLNKPVVKMNRRI